MHYVKLFNINGVDTKQIACIELQGPPNAATEGAVGVLGMDVTSPTYEVYRCVAVNGNVYTWQLLSAGMSVVGAKITREGATNTSFAYSDLKIPANYLLKVGDLILDANGYLYQVVSVTGESCNVTYCGTHLGGAGVGDKDYRIIVKDGKLQLVTENGNVLSEVDFLIPDDTTIHRVPSDGNAYVTGVRTINETVLRFFKGTQAEYDAVNDDIKGNLFAIITDDSKNRWLEIEHDKSMNKWPHGDVSITHNVANSANTRTKGFIVPVEGGKTYTLSWDIHHTGYTNVSGWALVRNASGYLSPSISGQGINTGGTFTTPSGCEFVIIELYAAFDETTENTATYSNVMLNEGEVALPYLPYGGGNVVRSGVLQRFKSVFDKTDDSNVDVFELAKQTFKKYTDQGWVSANLVVRGSQHIAWGYLVGSNGSEYGKVFVTGYGYAPEVFDVSAGVWTRTTMPHDTSGTYPNMSVGNATEAQFARKADEAVYCDEANVASKLANGFVTVDAYGMNWNSAGLLAICVAYNGVRFSGLMYINDARVSTSTTLYTNGDYAGGYYINCRYTPGEIKCTKYDHDGANEQQCLIVGYAHLGD